MIVEALIGGVTVCYVASLSFAKWSLKRLDHLDELAGPKPRLTKEAIEEKRRVLERDRKEWAEVFGSKEESRRRAATDAVKKIDNQLLALADELRE